METIEFGRLGGRCIGGPLGNKQILGHFVERVI
jgi:hypothetical protein